MTSSKSNGVSADRIDVTTEDVSAVETKFIASQQDKIALADSVMSLFSSVARVQGSSTEFRAVLEEMSKKYEVPENEQWEMSREDAGFVRRSVDESQATT